MHTTTNTKTKHPADGSPRWTVTGDAGTVMYDLLGNHLALLFADGEIDSMGKRWADLAARRAGDDEAMFDLLTNHYVNHLATEAVAR